MIPIGERLKNIFRHILESEVAALEKQMAAGVVNDELLKKYGETQKELEEAMTEWEKATEEEEEVKSKR